MLYALGVLVAIMAAVLVKTTAIDGSGLAKVNLASFNPLTVAPIANQSTTTGAPVVPIAPTATDAQTSPFPVITWIATGLPPGITISHTSGLISGTATLAGTYQVTIQAKDNAHPPTYGSTSFNWYVGNMAPQIVQVVPVMGQGVGGIRVVITGKNFVDATSVKFGDVPAGAITVNRSGTKITTFAPAESSGTVDIRVTALGGTSDVSADDQFTYLAPNITLVSNAIGPTGGGTRVRIAGTGLAGATSVSFGGVASSDFTVRHKGTMLTAVAPAGTPSTVQIVVVTPGGTTTSGGRGFTYVVPAPPAAHHRK
ncbi:MAG TPA: IPT/TIG domain-containing protein [Acidimicrobiales bacterium]